MDGTTEITMRPETAIDKIAEALAAAQAEITSPPRNREVEVKTKTGGSYKFRYATLDAIIDHVRPSLTKNGLWFTQTLQNGDGKYRLITTLMHASGQYIRSETPLLVTDQGNQAFGSALTYMRRYALTALLGVAADEDDDANAADGNTITKATTTPAGNGAKPPSGQRFGGPLNVTQLKAKMREFAHDLASVADIDSLTALLNERKDVLDQCMRDLPDWWFGGGDNEGAQARIENVRKGLMQNATLGAG